MQARRSSKPTPSTPSRFCVHPACPYHWQPLPEDLMNNLTQSEPQASASAVFPTSIPPADLPTTANPTVATSRPTGNIHNQTPHQESRERESRESRESFEASAALGAIAQIWQRHMATILQNAETPETWARLLQTMQTMMQSRPQRPTDQTYAASHHDVAPELRTPPSPRGDRPYTNPLSQDSEVSRRLLHLESRMESVITLLERFASHATPSTMPPSTLPVRKAGKVKRIQRARDQETQNKHSDAVSARPTTRSRAQTAPQGSRSRRRSP